MSLAHVAFIGKIYIGFYQSQRIKQGIPPLRYRMRQRAIKLGHGLLVLERSFSFNQIRNRFGLGKVHLTRSHGPPCKLPWTSQPCTKSHKFFCQSLNQKHIAVDVKLGGVLPRWAFGGREV